MSNVHSLTINVEGKSAEHLKKLLELALFELQELQKRSWRKRDGDSLTLQMSGDMGCYTLEYKLGSHTLVAAQADLIAQGYRKTYVTEWRTENYSVFEHDDKPPVRLYLESVRVDEHDVEEHEKNNVSF
ncbi:hypothetical protein YA0637_07215 [Pseudomonas syringae]|uniref:hypothetical protein n=1 Tax=Pseudomonas syringae TaxID=317 RepID=UPI0006B9E197|nr:hypothetical protein [Pseudomonas syringae]MBI6671334.1 hypothetical protein [Pseudomonas syringae]MCK9710179.1 hypothetical protein [Pseudomonas syringae pv. syringae]QQQ52049.1 hypothetical protein JJQ97_07445 [Pseudomonas syringae]